MFPEYFANNPDRNVREYQTKYGIYEPNCGLENLHMSFGHDGYIAEVFPETVEPSDTRVKTAIARGLTDS